MQKPVLEKFGSLVVVRDDLLPGRTKIRCKGVAVYSGKGIAWRVVLECSGING